MTGATLWRRRAVGAVALAALYCVWLAAPVADASCNEAICASLVSKCLLLKACECDMTDKRNCTCCSQCSKCLAKRYPYCCSCLGKNAAFIRTVTCSSILKEYDSGYTDAHRIGSYLEDDGSYGEASILYVLLRAAERFHVQYNRYPGCYEDEVETDVPLLKACITKLLSDWGLQQSIKDEYIHEFCCYGASELHSVAAYLSGIAAQEIIKIITRQYVPLNGMLIYNAITQIAVTLQL